MEFHLNPEIIIGIILIVWGASILIKLFCGIDIPVFKPLLALFLIYLGLTLLFDEPIFKCSFKKKVYTFTAHPEEEKKE